MWQGTFLIARLEKPNGKCQATLQGIVENRDFMFYSTKGLCSTGGHVSTLAWWIEFLAGSL